VESNDVAIRYGSSGLLMALAALVAVALSGCASVNGPAQGMAANGGVAQSGVGRVDAIYAALYQGVQSYQDALAAQHRADPGAGQAILNALNRVSAAAQSCAGTPGCDMQRVSAAYDRMMRLRENVGSDRAALVGTNADALAGEPSPVLQVVPQTQRAVALLKNGGLSDLVANNDAVKAAIEEWLTQMRSQLMSSYVNYQFLRSEMEPAYHKAGLPEALLFGIMAIESAGKVHAVSRAGAAGPLQFMPATAAQYGLKVVNGFDQRFDPRLEALANAEFINQQLKAFNDNLALTLAAYNAGPGFIGRLVGSGDASFWSPQVYDALAPETREYVPMVLAAAWLFLHPGRYNLALPQIDGIPGHIKLLTPASLSELTVCLGQANHMQDGWFRTLRNLNPQLDPQAVQPAGTKLRIPRQLEIAYASECAPGGRWMSLAETLHAAVPPPVWAASPPAPRREVAAVRHYRVRPGDTLNGIAQHFGCADPLAIARANDLRAPAYTIRPGMNLRVPACAGMGQGELAAVRSYVVQPGDTLNGIAQHFGCADPLAIARANGLQAPAYMINPGMHLNVPACGGAAVQRSVAVVRTYHVQPGDTLGSIAQRFGCPDVASIAQANGLGTPYLITAGMELRLPSCHRG
jgi:membrane-bound lytic murein transglycosylase D